ncbi:MULTISPECIES: oligosaccharide flippase family protein [Coprobacillaceae]|uniref:oligosaccharide flippase family protein n=1 Tax=Coprobacillaceae TaxID=2810280 RepID=UPI000E49875C|nr:MULTISPECIES: oligosaccharide flippase family protein [Coprobacillaceae]RHM59393.1 flippase [Coprobacillus sp. AF33-1AC]RHS91760.1 flippase [Erysipelatoclostridium sp. AM42-17]
MKSLRVNTILNIIKTASSIIFPFITFPYVSRVLMPEYIGKVNFGSSYVSYFSLIATLGITTYAVRECSKCKNDKNKLSREASEIYSINIFTTIIAYVLLFLSIILFKDLNNYRNLIIIQSTAILFTTLGADWINTTMEDYVYITIRSVVFEALALILTLLFVKKPSDYMLYAAITVLSTSGANIMNIFYRKKFCNIKITWNIDWKRHMKPILCLFVMLLSQTIFNSSDITMLGLIKGDFDVGLYSTAVKIINIINQLIASVLWVVLPRLSVYFVENDYPKINSLLRKILGLIVVLGLPCVVGTIAISKNIIYIVGGDSYLAATTTLKILSVGLLFSLFGGGFIGNIILLPSGQENYYMKVCCINAVFNIVANIFLIPLFGSNGAALSTAASSLLILILLIPKFDRRIKIDNLLGLITAPALGCVIIYIICRIVFLFQLNMYIETILCLGLSAFTYLLLLLISKNEIVYPIVSNIVDKIKKRD